MNPFRGGCICVFAILFTVGMNFAPGTVFAQNRAQGEFRLSQTTHWGGAILQEGNYQYSVEAESGPAVMHVWRKGGGFSGMFMAQSVLKNATGGQTEIVYESVGDATYVSSFSVPGLNAELGFFTPGANEASGDADVDGAPDLSASDAETPQLFKVVNPNHVSVSIAEAEKVYLNVCDEVEREFNRPAAVRPRVILHLGAANNIVRYPKREIMLKKWDEFRFAQAVVEIAIHDLVSPSERLRISKTAVHKADMTVSLCELKGCRN